MGFAWKWKETVLRVLYRRLILDRERERVGLSNSLAKEKRLLLGR